MQQQNTATLPVPVNHRNLRAIVEDGVRRHATGPQRERAPERISFDLTIMMPVRVTGVVEIWEERGVPDGPGYEWRLSEADMHPAGSARPLVVPADSADFAEIEGSDELGEEIAQRAAR
ncbi:hypothetical protein DB346_05365 [Verrucomicrobia bacterium LW23]|nr:hypothetical protein DB346_05365 [Verrucomicrobia bacterium LW23]